MRRTLLLVLALAVVLAAAGCSDDDDSRDEVEFELLGQGELSNFSLLGGGGSLAAVTLFRFTSDDGFAEFWTKHVAGFEPPPARPSVDFRTSTVVAVLDVVEPSTGHRITVSRLEESDDEIIVVAEKRSPGPRCGRGAQVTQPFAIIRVPRPDAMFRLSLSSVVEDCP